VSVLDRPETYDRLDLGGMRHLIAGLPEQSRSAWDAGQGWPIPPSFKKPSRVVVLGMGGSAIGGDLIATLCTQSSAVPIQVVRGYTMPATDEHTLVVASSFSGETEETLETFNAALQRPGMHLALTSGGRLGRLADSLGYSVLRYDFQGQPRSALGWGVFPLLAVLQRLGVIQVDEGAVEATIDELTQAASDWGIDQPCQENAAKLIATALHGRIPLIVGTDFFEVVARRWAGQMNENAKQWAFHVALPEANHNLIVGFGSPAAAREALHVLFLDCALLHERNRLRVRMTAEALDRAGISHDELIIGGADPLDAMLRASYLGDWVSLYLGMLNEVDPTPVEPLDRLKSEMARHGHG
jgi:glucose/mannose-6-phosphate isomerase